ncbi:MAG: fumarylacetoacetate hydrolase family protein [Chloroflexota bacterium]|nr:fumarylacetoacetate hydrolase family protein [Chloroflexota bacterium]
MIPDFSLCRFRVGGAPPHLGLISGEKLYDLTASGRHQYTDMSAWLETAAGSAEEAFSTLEQMADELQALAAADSLLQGDTEMRLLAPLDEQEVWACGVTYEMSREARMRESGEPTIYGRVYDAARPEIFFKSTPHRVVGPDEPVAIRGDSGWDVPEAEMVLVVTPQMQIVGYTVGNDMSSREIEGENPLYLPQAKVYDRSCALGPFVRLAKDFDPLDQAVVCVVKRDGEEIFRGETRTSSIHRPLSDLVSYLGRCNSFPKGVFVMTGTGIVPPDSFSLQEDDIIEITFEGLGTLRNPVIELPV